MQYQARIEKNSKNLGETQEITEYYDGVNNIGVSINRYFRNKVQTYSYYDTDELFVVEGILIFQRFSKQTYFYYFIFVKITNVQDIKLVKLYHMV